MFEHQKHIEIERRVLKAGDDRARAGLPPANPDSLRLIAAHDLERELEAKRQERAAQLRALPRPVSLVSRPIASRAVAPVTRPTKPPAMAPVKPLAKPVATAKPPVPPYLAAERARVCAIIAAAPAGAEVERDAAIASGANSETFRSILAGRAILDARRQAGS